MFAPNKLDLVDTTPVKTPQSIAAPNSSLQLTTLDKSLYNATLTSTPLKRPSGHSNKNDYDGKKTNHAQEQASYEGPSTFPDDALILSANLVRIGQERAYRKIILRGYGNKIQNVSLQEQELINSSQFNNEISDEWMHRKESDAHPYIQTRPLRGGK